MNGKVRKKKVNSTAFDPVYNPNHRFLGLSREREFQCRGRIPTMIIPGGIFMRKTLLYAAVISLFCIMQTNLGLASQLKGGYKASNLIGKEVKNQEGKELGEIQELVLEEDRHGYVEISRFHYPMTDRRGGCPG
jgi:hypothetical protein